MKFLLNNKGVWKFDVKYALDKQSFTAAAFMWKSNPPGKWLIPRFYWFLCLALTLPLTADNGRIWWPKVPQNYVPTQQKELVKMPQCRTHSFHLPQLLSGWGFDFPFFLPLIHVAFKWKIERDVGIGPAPKGVCGVWHTLDISNGQQNAKEINLSWQRKEMIKRELALFIRSSDEFA